MRRRPRSVLVAALAVAAAACTAVKNDDAGTTTVPSPDASATTGLPAATTTTTAPPGNLAAVEVELQEIAEVESPTAMAVRNGDASLYVTEQVGRVRRITVETRRGSDGRPRPPTFAVEPTPVLDIRDDVTDGGERGLLGLAFSTDGNRLYIAYTGNDERQHLDEYEIGADTVDTRSRREILVIDDFAPNHNGGNVAFGPDGFLYWSMGDGGGGGDPQDTGQDPGDLLGSLLRIDPDVAPEDRGDIGYDIPVGNPFADGGGAPEVWTYGLRNPWRFSFDRATGDLWIADVGQDEFEEIDFLPSDNGANAGRGANLGWSALEGDQLFNADAEPEGTVTPLFTYDHGSGRCSITGGYVYRGAAIPDLTGAYLFADVCSGPIRALVQRDGEVVLERDLGIQADQVSSFGQDTAGELYVLSLTGTIFKVVAG